jgi:hypothetical protein
MSESTQVPLLESLDKALSENEPRKKAKNMPSPPISFVEATFALKVIADTGVCTIKEINIYYERIIRLFVF